MLVMDWLFREVYKRYGLVTQILEASSTKWEFEACRHPNYSHAGADGLDLRYYGWETGELLVEPTWWLFKNMRNIWPDIWPQVGDSVKDELYRLSGEWAPWISGGGEQWNHEFDPENWASHAHIAMKKSEINRNAVIKEY